jgi:hypothetical protein
LGYQDGPHLLAVGRGDRVPGPRGNRPLVTHSWWRRGTLVVERDEGSVTSKWDATMLARLHHQLERTANGATLYLTGRLRAGDKVTLLQLISGLPREVRTLRLDLHALGDVDETTIEWVRLVLSHWRERWRVNSRLASSTGGAEDLLEVRANDRIAFA